MPNHTIENYDHRSVFWAELTPCEHVMQIYAEEDAFMDALDGFVAGGLRSGDAVLIIATPAHREALEARLRTAGLDLEAARSANLYLAFDAVGTLLRFSEGGWPDEDRFRSTILELLHRSRGAGRRVRAFSEMVAVLWAQGHNGGTIRLEHLWRNLCSEESFSVFCAYPRIGLTQDSARSVREICELHARIVPE